MSKNSGVETLVAMMQVESRKAAIAMMQGKCCLCRKPVRPNPFKQGTPAKGDIFTAAGAREYRISGTCEFCFDDAFGREDK